MLIASYPQGVSIDALLQALSTVIAAIVRLGEAATPASIAAHTPAEVAQPDRDRFTALVLAEFQTINPGSAVRFGLRPLEFAAWQAQQGPETGLRLAD